MNSVGITYPDINNGLGFRVTLWISGCTHKCKNCHNEWLQDYSKGDNLENYKDAIYIALNKPYIKGLTISGGDPLDQNESDLKELEQFIRQIKIDFPNKDIWIYSGDTYENLISVPIKKKIIFLCDVLIDGPFVESKKDLSLAFRGSSNQRIIYIKK